MMGALSDQDIGLPRRPFNGAKSRFFLIGTQEMPDKHGGIHRIE